MSDTENPQNTWCTRKSLSISPEIKKYVKKKKENLKSLREQNNFRKELNIEISRINLKLVDCENEIKRLKERLSCCKSLLEN